MSKKYTLIYADPPWTYRDKAKDGERGAGHKYQTMTVLDICRLPVWELALGMGHMTRANSEDCLFAVQGKLPARLDAGIVQSFTAPRLEHSRKPDIVREKLVQLLGDVPRIELFARQSSHGFDVWGNQCDSPAVALLPGIAEYIGEAE
ncbi:MT-A70 family methyltransferase [Klebsiella oxytoca]|uniref:MT-A70 family methyltransferase n=1 Tax=Klebsiella oxytoca TaxID=571 RepID=UPI0038B974D1